MIARRALGLVARAAPPLQRLREQRNALARDVASLERQLRVAQQGIPEPKLYPDGHFYSPLPDLDELRGRDDDVFRERPDVPGVELRVDAQLALADELGALVHDQPFSADAAGDGLRYHFANDYFGHGDGIVLHAMLRRHRPRRVVEVGSGHSSAMMLDTDERFLGSSTQFTFIEPYPERLLGLLRPEDHERATVVQERVQLVDPSVFADLQAGDLLFIDSSHVSKVGSDVNVLLLDIVPSLPPGVLVHVHDVCWPFEYSRAWVYEGRAWNEAYVVRALLTGNPHLQVLWFADQLARLHHERIARALPLWAKDTGTSLWLQTG